MKKIIALVLAAVMISGASIAGTIAYLTDKDSDVNVMVLGKVDIDQREHKRDGSLFVQDQKLLPLVGDTSTKDTAGYPAAENYIDKIVTIKNEAASENAYIRTFIAVPAYSYDGQASGAFANVLHWNGYSEGDAAPAYPAATKVPDLTEAVDNHWWWGKKDASAWPGNGGDWNKFTANIDGKDYEVYVVTHTTVVEPGKTTAPNMIGVYLDSKVDFDGTNYTYDGKKIEGLSGNKVDVLVATQAVQAKGWANAWEALDGAFGEPSANNHPWVPATTTP